MPKSLTEDTGVSSWSRKGTLMSDSLLRSCLVPKKVSLVLLGCNTSQKRDVGLPSFLQGKNSCF